MDAMSKSPGAKVIFMPFNSSHDGSSGSSISNAIVGSAAMHHAMADKYNYNYY
jgi:hypothetical protein